MEKLLLTRKEAAEVLNISVDTLDSLRNIIVTLFSISAPPLLQMPSAHLGYSRHARRYLHSGSSSCSARNPEYPR